MLHQLTSVMLSFTGWELEDTKHLKGKLKLLNSKSVDDRVQVVLFVVTWQIAIDWLKEMFWTYNVQYYAQLHTRLKECLVSFFFADNHNVPFIYYNLYIHLQDKHHDILIHISYRTQYTVRNDFTGQFKRDEYIAR